MLKDLDLRDLDYFVYITNDRKQWNIWCTGTGRMFTRMNGNVEIPRTYDVMQGNTDPRSNTLDSFVLK